MAVPDQVSAPSWNHLSPGHSTPRALIGRTLSDQARVLTLRDEYWDITFEMQRSRAPEVLKRDSKRLGEIVEDLARLGADVGPRPADLPSNPT